MTRWEYCELDLAEISKKLREVDLLNRAGAQGWELITIRSPFRALMKRPLPSAGRPRVAAPQTVPDVRQAK
jgi:hypothetical protein